MTASAARGRYALVVGVTLGLLRVSRVAPADDLSGADKLRALYSAEFRFNNEGVPIVPVAIADSLTAVTLTASGGLRLLPEGEGGPEIRADEVWQVRAFGSTSAAKLRYWSIVWRGPAAERVAASAEGDRWKARGEKTRIFEQGTLFGVAGEVLDRRELLVAVGPVATFEEAERAAERLARKAKPAAGGVFTELVDRPHGQLEAVGTRTGARVRNEGALWFVAADGAPLKVDGQGGVRVSGTYHGRVYVTLDRRGTLAVVNALPEDRLLAGLVPAEIFPNAPDEALKAQAVAARGELLVKIGMRHVGDPFRLCARTHCQVYSGAGRETPRTTAAVAATRGEVLFTQHSKDLADTVYSANCGGHTENNENVWADMPVHATLRGRRDADGADVFASGINDGNVARFLSEAPASHCRDVRIAGSDRFRWTVTRSAAELGTSLAAHRLGDVRTIEILERGVSGRARAVRVVGSLRSEVIKGELRIRQAFGGLRSSMFVVQVSAGAATFRGGGFGHGVGLCQTGAIGMAAAGKSYKDILSHFYQGSVLRKLW